jgi:hypothetical protein
LLRGWVPSRKRAALPPARNPLLLSHLRRDQSSLYAVEEAFQPPDQLGLRDPELGVARSGLVEGQGDAVEFVHEFGGEAVFEFFDGAAVDFGEAATAGLIEGGRADFVEKVLDHGPNAHDLGWLFDQVCGVAAFGFGTVAGACTAGGGTTGARCRLAHAHAVWGDDDHARVG